jgi:hypothetical protein
MKKSFPIATFVRHSISKLPEHYYALPIDNIKEHIAIWKGFFHIRLSSTAVFGFIAYSPEYSFTVITLTEQMQIPHSRGAITFSKKKSET